MNRKTKRYEDHLPIGELDLKVHIQQTLISPSQLAVKTPRPLHPKPPPSLLDLATHRRKRIRVGLLPTKYVYTQVYTAPTA